MTAAIRILGHAARSGVSDYSAAFTLRTWFLGWYSRILAQVLFFATIGSLLGHSQTGYLLVGNAVFMMTLHSLLTTASTTWEKDAGTLPLLVAAPAPPALVLVGRSLFWIPAGLASAVGSLLLIGFPLRVSLPLDRLLWCVPMFILVGLTSYGLGLFLGALVLHRNDLRNLVNNAVTTAMMAICGVNVPASVLPAPIRAVAEILPTTHGLRAIRSALAGGPLADILPELGWETATGVGWFVAALVVLRWLEVRSRRDGRIVFSG